MEPSYKQKDRAALDKPSLDVLILKALFENPGQFVSGAQLAEKAGVTRAAIWKHLEHLQQIGYVVEAQPHYGYRITELPDVWCAEEIIARLGSRDKSTIAWQPVVLPETSSTNDLVWKEAQSGHPEGLIIAADRQTKGRGRQGRVWESPKVCGLYATALLRPGWPVYHAARITILVSLALAEALEALCRTKIEIKWPNDLFIRGKKLGGILTEMASDPEKILFAVVGFGINISQKKTDFSPDTRDKATSLFIQTSQTFRRADVLVKILQTLGKVYAEPFPQVRKRWLERCLTVGKTVTVRTPSGEVTGQALDIDENGALILRGESGHSFVLTAGDVL